MDDVQGYITAICEQHHFDVFQPEGIKGNKEAPYYRVDDLIEVTLPEMRRKTTDRQSLIRLDLFIAFILRPRCQQIQDFVLREALMRVTAYNSILAPSSQYIKASPSTVNNFLPYTSLSFY